MNVDIIRDEIGFFTGDSYEADVRSFWHNVLREYFPSSEGYVVKDEAPNNYGISDIVVYEHRRTPGGRLFRHCFLIVQCKRVSFETQDAVWAEAEDQLEQYLASTHKRTRPANRTPVYGAVAVGRKIGFYKYNHNSKAIRAWRPAARSSFDVRKHDDPRFIESAMMYIHQHH